MAKHSKPQYGSYDFTAREAKAEIIKMVADGVTIDRAV